MNRRAVVDDHALPESLAGIDEAIVLWAVGLVVVVVFEILEVERERVAEGVIGHGAMRGRCGFADEAVGEVVDLKEVHHLGLEGGVLFGGEVGFEPEVNVVDHGGGGVMSADDRRAVSICKDDESGGQASGAESRLALLT